MASYSPSPVSADLSLLSFSPSELTHPWYAIRTRSNQERTAAASLIGRGFEPYLPVYQSRRQWADRVVTTELPLFPGYIFCRFDATHRLPIITTPGVVSILGFGNEPAAIPEQQIAAVHRILCSGLSAEPCGFLAEGQRVRVTQGPLKDLEGLLLKIKSDLRLLVSIVMLQRSVSVEIDRDFVQPL